jgi:lysozyme family protein
MASFDRYAQRLLRLEGGYDYDNGNHSNRGITLATYTAWRKVKGIAITTVSDIKNITGSEARSIYKSWYWDVLLANQIKNQSIAELMVDGKVNGGFSLSSLQVYLKITADGKMGPKTIAAINASNQAKLHAKLLQDRKNHYADLINTNPFLYAKYTDGWANRLKDFVFDGSVGSGISAGVLVGTVAALFYLNKA